MNGYFWSVLSNSGCAGAIRVLRYVIYCSLWSWLKNIKLLLIRVCII